MNQSSKNGDLSKERYKRENEWNMKRKKIIILDIIIVVLAIILLFFVVAAGIYFVKVYPRSVVIDNIILEVKEGTITKTGATFIITNKNDYRWSHSKKCIIQVKKFGLWINQPWIVDKYTIPLVVAMEPIGICEVKVDWSKLYGELEKGQYRYGIAKKVRGNEYIFAEFTIE